MSRLRPDWDEYFLRIAEVVSERSDCDRRRVGAVIVKDRRIVGTGYNGAPAGAPGCDTCPRRLSGVVAFSSYDTGPGSCIAIHAEANALIYTDRLDLVGATMYTTCKPCDGCSKLIAAAQLEGVHWREVDPL